MVIYKTTNLINGKFYVGKDVRNLNCYLGSGKLLKSAIKKYGKNNFVKEILEICDNLTDLEEREKFWIKELDSINNGYNLTEGGTGGDTFTNNSNKEEIRNKLKKRIVSEEVKMIRLNNLIPFQYGENHPNFGKKQSQETKEKRLISFQKKGFKSPMEGKNHTEETKQKIREKKIGTILSEETKKKMRNSSNKGGKQKIFVCPYCDKQGGNTMFRWHFENCKNK
jgi:group I intron endonuclease